MVKSISEIMNWYYSHRASLIQYFSISCFAIDTEFVMLFFLMTFTIIFPLRHLRHRNQSYYYGIRYRKLRIFRTISMPSIRYLIKCWRLSWVCIESNWDIHNWKNIEVLSDMNWSSDERRSSLNYRFRDIRISQTQYINTFRGSNQNLTWAFRDQVQQSDLNAIFASMILDPLRYLPESFLQTDRHYENVTHHILIWSERSFSEKMISSYAERGSRLSRQ